MASETILAIRAAPTHAAPSSERIAQNEQNEQGILEAQTSCLTTENLQVIVRAIGTGPAPITCSGVDLAQHESPPQDGKQLGAENPDKHDSPALSDRGNSPHGSCFQGVSAATAAIAITYSPAAFSADANRRSASASLTSLESNLVRGQQDTASYKGASPPNSHGKANCLEPRLETITASLRPGIDFTAVPRSALASLETIHAVQNKDKASDKGGVAVEFDIESDDDVVSQEPPRDIPRATTPSVQRPTTSRHPTAATGYRALHSTRMRRRCSHRTVQKTVKGGNQASQRPRALQAPQADIAVTRRPGIPKVDMRGVSHVVGGLVEHSLGFDNPLFAKQVEGDRSDPYNTIKVVRHEFFRFPPPDMGEHNREFERELEESRPIYEGFDSATIDQQLHGYVAHTKVFTEVMGEHLAHLNRLDTLFVSNKKKLAHLGHERQRAMANTSSRGEAMTRKEQVKVIARVAEAEELLMKEQDAVREELNEVIMRGRANITRALGQDLGAPAMIDRQRTRANQRKIIEERDTEMGIAAAMVGLRGNLKEQDDQTHEAIMRNAQLVVDERMKAFDQEDNWRRPEKPAPVTPTPNVDTIVTSVPEWFTILEAKKAISLRGATLLEKFKDLLLQMRTSVHDAREEQRDEELRPTKHKWNKQYHKPDDAWPNAVQRINGGWWHCRGGPDAPPPERNCKLCHREVPAEAPGPSATTRHQRLLEEIEMAQAEANRKDRLFLKYRLQQEHENINRYWQHREWRRSGGGVSISEVLHGRDVNDLNYRSSAEPQSWQHPGALFRSPESDQKQAVQETLAPETTPLPSPQHPCGFQVPELLSGRQISPGSRSAGGPSTPPRHMSRSPLFYEVLPGGQLNRDPGLHNKSPSRPARRLHGSPMSHEVLSSRNIDKDISTQAAPIPGLHRHNSSQVHDILHDRQVNNDTLSPTQDRPPRPRSSMSRPGQTNKPKTVSWQL